MKKTITFLSLTAIVILIGFNSCKDSNTENSENKFVFESYDVKPISNTKGKSLSAFIAPADAPTCTVIPTQAEVNNGQWTFTDHFYSASQALKIGIPIVNMNASNDLKVYVKDYRRVSPCTASDNTTTIFYGQVVRTVIEIENYDASVGVDLASIAANGTLKKNTQHFYFYKDGFFNQGIDDIIASVQGKTFDVENYALYQSVMGDVIRLLKDPKTDLDVTIFKTDRPIKRPILSYEKSSLLKKGNEIYMLGYPMGLPLKLAINADISDDSNYQFFYTTLDSFQGNSGSPVFNLKSHKLIGILVSGMIDYQLRGDCYKSVVCRQPYCSGEKVIRIELVLD